jgi:spermidine synthase
MSGKFEHLSFEPPFVHVQDGVRSLHFTYGEVQSSMRLDQPDDLEIDYTRTMMGFVLLQPQPRHITMIGLGGGSLAKFCYRHLPSARITAVEINPAVIALRREFGIPEDDARLQVLADDGAQYLQHAASDVDVLLVDAFDYAGQSPQVCSQAFYDDCLRCLQPGGVMAVNLHADHPEFELHLERIAASFRGNAVQVLSEEESNCVVLAGRGRPVTVQALRTPTAPSSNTASWQEPLQRELQRISWQASAVRPSRLVPPARA